VVLLASPVTVGGSSVRRGPSTQLHAWHAGNSQEAFPPPRVLLDTGIPRGLVAEKREL
jgi:hypothetical protein